MISRRLLNCVLLGLVGVFLALSACLRRQIPTTPLCGAAVDGDIKKVKELIRAGENVNEPDSNGLTPLAWASRGPGASVVPILVKAGADVNLRANGWPPLAHAAAHGNAAVARALLDNGADINARADNGWTPLMVSIGGVDDKLTAMLLDRGADPFITAPDGSTALTLAVAHGDPEGHGAMGCRTNLVRLLLSRYPALSIPKTAWGKRALELARGMHCDEILAMVRER